jgi:hypothetical protein
MKVNVGRPLAGSPAFGPTVRPVYRGGNGDGGEYTRQGYWFGFLNSGSRIQVPFAAITSDGSGTIEIQLTFGSPQIVNSAVFTSGTYNTSNAFGVGVNFSSTVPAADGDVRARIATSVKTASNVHSLVSSQWVVVKVKIDFDLKDTYYEIWPEADEGSKVTGAFGFGAAQINNWTADTNLILGNALNALFGGMRGYIKEVYLWDDGVLKGYWPIDDNDTTIVDRSGNGNDGTLTPSTDTWTGTDPY